MRPHIVDASGRVRAPFVYPLVLENRLERRYVEDRSRPLPLRLFQHGSVLSVDPSETAPWFPLGTDALGRDQLARLAFGTRLSLGVAIAAALGALAIGALIGAVAGFVNGLLDEGLMRASDFVLALPVVYVVLALRAAMPLVLSTPQVFWTMVIVLAAVGWPLPARGYGPSSPPNGTASTQKLRAPWGRVVRGYCYVTCCRPRADCWSSRPLCCCPPSCWRKPPCHS
jgi:ABC-type dipeptide/oligopeptide/nickel transport system permease subunit